MVYSVIPDELEAIIDGLTGYEACAMNALLYQGRNTLTELAVCLNHSVEKAKNVIDGLVAKGLVETSGSRIVSTALARKWHAKQFPGNAKPQITSL